MRLLIVEDDLSYCQAYIDCLDHLRQSCGEYVRYDIVDNYDDFIAYCEMNNPNVVWTDHRIRGEKNGADVAQWLASNRPNVVCISVSSLREKGYPHDHKNFARIGKSMPIRELYEGTKTWLETGNQDWS